MTDRPGEYPSDDEPVIGLAYPPGPPRPPVAPSEAETGASAGYRDGDPDDWGDDAPGYDDDYDEYGDPYYADPRYASDQPVRHPAFYAVLALAVIVGAGAVFALFTYVRGGDDDDPSPTPTIDAQFRVQISAPVAGDRLRIGEDHTIITQATSTERITEFALLVNSEEVDRVDATDPDAGHVYNATLHAQFDERGEYDLVVRVFSESGASDDSPAVTVNAIEEPGERPVSIEGRVVAATTLYLLPSTTSEEAGSLQSGQTVDIIGRTRDNGWLQLDIDGGRWVRRTAIQELESLALIPFRDPSPTVQPTQTPRPTETPTPTIEPSPDPSELPDFVPVDARLVFGENGDPILRVTVRNAGAPYDGPLEISASTSPDVGGGSLAFNIELDTDDTTTVDFELGGNLPATIDVTVRIDPSNAVPEIVEDNNQTTFRGVDAPQEPPMLEIDGVNVSGSNLQVTVTNSGNGALASGREITVRAGDASASRDGGLAPGQSVQFVLPVPAGAGEVTVELLVGGVPVDSVTVQIDDETPSATATATATQDGETSPTTQA